MRILKMKPEQKPERVDIPDTLEAMQKVVGGYIHLIPAFKLQVAGFKVVARCISSS